MTLTTEQQRAILAEKSVAVIASAGTGKTTVLTARFLDILTRRQISLSRILAFTFTEKAAREMKERILKACALPVTDLPQLRVGTIHSFLNRFLRRHGGLAGLSSDFVILEEHAFNTWLNHEIQMHVARALSEKKQAVLDFARQYGLSRLTETTEKFLSQYRTFNKDPQQIETDTDKFVAWCVELRDMLFAQRLHHATLCFDDLENLSLKILREHPALRTELQERHTHILVDECQDISPAQHELIHLLFDPEKNTLFLVGDPKQSIYGFREAGTALFANLMEMVQQSGGEIIPLSTTFRTPQQIQNYFNTVFPHILNSNGEALYAQALAEKEDELAAIFAATAPSEDEANFSEARANEVSLLVKELIHSGVDPAQIAILSATRRFFPLLEQKFTAAGIPVITDTKSKHFAEDMITLFFHLFLYLGGNREKITQVGLLRNPLLGFSEKFIMKLLQQDTADLFDRKRLQDNTLPDSDRFQKLCDILSTLRSQSPLLTPAGLLESAISQLQELFAGKGHDAHHIYLLRQFLQILRAWQKQGLSTMAEIYPLLRQWEQSHSEFRSLESGSQGISLLTIHGAKGLEFEHVILVPSGKSPSSKSVFLHDRERGVIFKDHDEGHITTLKAKLDKGERYTELAELQQHLDTRETTRLIYVALTRTQKNLYIFPPKISSQTLAKLLEKKTAKISDIKTYNNWLCWLSRQERVKDLQELKLSNSPPNPLSYYAREGGLGLPSPSHLPMTSLTVTELENFFECPKKFELRRLYRVEALNNSPQPPLTLRGGGENSPPAPLLLRKRGESDRSVTAVQRGNFIHEVMQFFDPARDNLENVVEQALFNQHLSDPDGKFLHEAQEVIERIKRNPGLREILFQNKDSRQEIEFALAMDGFVLNGQIDRIINCGTIEKPNWIVVDYKTHATQDLRELDALSQQFKFQLGCYALALSRAHQQKKVEAFLLFTSSGEYRKFVFDEKNLMEFSEKLNGLFKDLVSAVSKNHFLLTTERKNCRHCLYYDGNYCGIKNLT